MAMLQTMRNRWNKRPLTARTLFSFFNNHKRNSKKNDLFSLFDIDDLESIQTLQDISRASLQQARVSQARRLLECVEECLEVGNYDGLISIHRLANDDLAVLRKEVCHHLGKIAGILIQKDPEKGISCVVSTFLPLVDAFLNDVDSSVRIAACETLIHLSAHLRWRSLSPVLALVLSVVQGADRRDIRCLASSLMNGLAVTVGKEICLSFFVPQIQCLAQDSDLSVRRSVVENMLEICHTIGSTDTSSKLLSTYRKFCKDVEWIIRRSAVENLPNFLMTINPSLRCSFVSILKDFLNDSHRCVRKDAMRQLGSVLATFPSPHCIPLDLLQKYSMWETCQPHTENAFPSLSSWSYPLCETNALENDEIAFACAYNFAGVFSVLGSTRWSMLSSTFWFLLRHPMMKIRKTLAASFHIMVYVQCALSLETKEGRGNGGVSLSPLEDTRCARCEGDASLREISLITAFPSSPSTLSPRTPLCSSLHGDAFSLFHSSASRQHSLWSSRSTIEFLSDDEFSTETYTKGGEISTSEKRRVEKELQKAYFLLLKDTHAAVRLATVCHLAKIFHLFSLDKEVLLFKILHEIMDESNLNWRIRSEIATQLTEILTHFFIPKNKEILYTLCSKLCQDPIAAVRTEAVKCIPHLFLRYSSTLLEYFTTTFTHTSFPSAFLLFNKSTDSSEEGEDASSLSSTTASFMEMEEDAPETETQTLHLSSTALEGNALASFISLDEAATRFLTAGEEIQFILHLLNKFPQHSNFQLRQCFLLMCDRILRKLPLNFFQCYFLHSFLSLSSDRIISVRIAWAKIVSTHLRMKSNGLQNTTEIIKTVKERLREETMKEVLQILKSIHLPSSF